MTTLSYLYTLPLYNIIYNMLVISIMYHVSAATIYIVAHMDFDIIAKVIVIHTENIFLLDDKDDKNDKYSIAFCTVYGIINRVTYSVRFSSL